MHTKGSRRNEELRQDFRHSTRKLRKYFGGLRDTEKISLQANTNVSEQIEKLNLLKF